MTPSIASFLGVEGGGGQEQLYEVSQHLAVKIEINTF